MTDDRFNVLLYVGGSEHSFSAAVYAATLLKRLPNIHLTVVQVQESTEGLLGSDNYQWTDIWPLTPNAVWMKKILNEADHETQKEYQDILDRTNEIFSQKGLNVKHEILAAHNNILDVAEAIIDYAAKNSFKLIIMGTRGLSDIKGLVFGSFAHTMLNRSPIPVLLIKKLPQEFIDNL
ncbi:universal stress protein UspA-like protein [Desulfosporosinus acidiphilus SJ4]|uniref:Universal stress protein UspA-like protein n=1 Tax=Desulfosporosinus acidiphilus (strain DSM 22704 / JCM 16185 / SJ4) TaxID=646529 RepID=I4D9L0_DESAJ|nr:universal stress protein [Desulfosporosinus acidiphilus]AFM42484.1 universal stress protein UspA-like protein [Desulfosporosinus acidiphilus SJ4]